MKRLTTFLTGIFISVIISAQDSTVVTTQWQARDMEYFYSQFLNATIFESVIDTVKIKLRAPGFPTGNQTASITAYTVDWINIYQRFVRDIVAIESGTEDRLRVLLLAINQPYLTSKINLLVTEKVNPFADSRKRARLLLRKTPNEQ